MQRRPSGIYEFRRRLPQALAGKPVPAWAKSPPHSELVNPSTGNFKQYLTVSLRTNDHRLAKRRDLDEARRVEGLFAFALEMTARGGPEAPAPDSPSGLPSLEEIESYFHRQVLQKDDEERAQGDPRRHLQTPLERTQWPALADARLGLLGMADGHHEVIGDLNAEHLRDYRNAYSRQRTDIVAVELAGFLRDRGAATVDPTSEYYHQAGLAALAGQIAGHEDIERRQAGAKVATPGPVVVNRGPKLSEAVTDWKAGTAARGGKKPTHSSVREAERAARFFVEFHGDLPLGDITKPKAREFRDALAKMPKRLKGTQRKMALRALVASTRPDQETIHANTVNKYLNCLTAVVNAALKDGRLDDVTGFTNPFSLLGISVDKRNDPNRRKLFSQSDLKAIFTSAIYSEGSRPKGGRGEAAYWLPLMALLTGARLNEIAQLRLEDIQQDEETGIWVVNIDTDGDRSVKTVSSRRQVPIHAELMRLGLLRYRDALLKAGAKKSSSMWPELYSADPKYRSTAWSKWFNRYLRETIGITDVGKVFHSFRHTFKRLGRDAVPEEMHDALTGHTGKGGVGRDYGDGFGLETLHAAISKIVVPQCVLDLPGKED
ncbi:site-specific integrase [Rhizobium sp. S96]|uniref:site-specific integrase n=1 Tax=Rhizobium sp. S96 TaxID=3055140 RepID=UPI0025AAAD57|nr:site-specific integrase [Rhizobium sp. S96]MDM9622704.1 tyrosine-type recombinase/integrase [Rhizobium sp. S96]